MSGSGNPGIQKMPAFDWRGLPRRPSRVGTCLPERRPIERSKLSINLSAVTSGGFIASRYFVLEEIGKGGYADVYFCRDTRTDSNVAVKISRPGDGPIEMMRDEIAAYETLGAGPNIVTCLAAGENFIVLEHLEGQSLSHLITEIHRDHRGKNNIDSVLAALLIIKEVLFGLEYAHGLDEVHADICPKNIMARRRPGGSYQATLIDWGMGRKYLRRPPGISFGKPIYMSPEQAGSRDIDHRSDIYSTGLVLFEILTGEYPVPGDSGDFDGYLLMSRRSHGLAFQEYYLSPVLDALGRSGLPDLSRSIARLLAKMTTYRFQESYPYVRFQSAMEARLAVEAILGKYPVP